jgi:hypothetical protein
MVKVIFWIIKAIAYVFIGIAKLTVILYYKIPKALKIQFLRSKYFEERILLVIGIVIFMGIFFLSVPIFLCFKFHDENWLFLLFASAVTTGVPMGYGLYYANHYQGNKRYVPGEVELEKISWGANTYIPDSHSHAITVDKDDPDFRKGMVEVEEHLDEEKNWEKRLNTGKRRR